MKLGKTKTLCFITSILIASNRLKYTCSNYFRKYISDSSPFIYLSFTHTYSPDVESKIVSHEKLCHGSGEFLFFSGLGKMVSYNKLRELCLFENVSIQVRNSDFFYFSFLINLSEYSVLYINVYIHVLCGCRGLDVQPTQILKFERQKDVESTSVLNIVYSEEITHVAAGMKWFNYICENSQPKLVSSAAAA